ncbi:hypothetical protein EKD02_02580 [Chlorobium phaeovibrioides]|uniref:Uncharacterized protein n=1 Tax=Chlorobium phaeovibrioides TaxID=1094 RepID=A0A432AWH8_CHLPH|nr:hypothetical protein [Chlorobium phaeovibrioides]RTY39576.1 hypothetical protein EKD02_02580 [Chlorobium phaeovibrioides]
MTFMDNDAEGRTAMLRRLLPFTFLPIRRPALLCRSGASGSAGEASAETEREGVEAVRWWVWHVTSGKSVARFGTVPQYARHSAGRLGHSVQHIRPAFSCNPHPRSTCAQIATMHPGSPTHHFEAMYAYGSRER